MKAFWTIFVLMISITLGAQEICNNAIDDDGDGLIDLNDEEDCICPSSVPSGLIPNPSFEDMLCCPTQKEQLDCAVSWIQASAATSDYLHLCGITVHPNVGKSAPMPIPDGEGYIGFRDGYSGQPGYKEYVGACLNETMEVGIIFDLYADKPYNVIVIGPGCTNQSNSGSNPYFFVDRLALALLTDFDVPFADIQGDLCQEDLTIIAEEDEDYGYQWFKDGVALIGETDISLDLDVDPVNEGFYEVLITTPDGCFNSEEFELFVPVFETNIEDQICEGETYIIAGNEVSATGAYSFPLVSQLGCDSVVNLNLEVLTVGTKFVTPTICEGEVYTYAGQTFTETGFYSFNTPAPGDCDSLISIDLTVSPRKENTYPFSICEGQFLQEGTDILDVTGIYTYTYDSSAGCDSTVILDLTVNEVYEVTSTATICEGETYQYGSQILTAAGPYEEVFSSATGCDSSVTLMLEVDNISTAIISETLCEGEFRVIANDTFDTEGSYVITTENVAGCDSLISYELSIVDWDNGIALPDDVTINLGNPVSISPSYIAPEMIDIVWTDTAGMVLSNEEILTIDEVIGVQDITVTGIDQYGCIDMDEIQIRVNRNIGVHLMVKTLSQESMYLSLLMWL